MKKIIIVLITLSLISCLGINNNTKQEEYYYPNGKTHQQWIDDEKYCQQKTGRLNGLWNITIFGIINNTGRVNREYNDCMKDFGW